MFIEKNIEMKKIEKKIQFYGPGEPKRILKRVNEIWFKVFKNSKKP